MNKEFISSLASEIIKEAGMKVIDPKKTQSRNILKALRSQFGIEAVNRPIWRQYVTNTEGTSNKYHYFVVFQDGDKYYAANAYGRIGYPSVKVKELYSGDSKNDAMNAAKTKLRKKLQKYEITKLF